jgi:hypothetical protein
MRCGAAMVICLLFPAGANSALKERDINYESGGVVPRGSLATTTHYRAAGLAFW